MRKPPSLQKYIEIHFKIDANKFQSLDKYILLFSQTRWRGTLATNLFLRIYLLLQKPQKTEKLENQTQTGVNFQIQYKFS